MTLPAEPIFDDDDNSGGRGGQGGIDLDFNVVKDVSNFWKIFWLTKTSSSVVRLLILQCANIQISKYLKIKTSKYPIHEPNYPDIQISRWLGWTGRGAGWTRWPTKKLIPKKIVDVSKITIALTGGYYPGDEEAMENPRGVSSSLPGHMCTVVFSSISQSSPSTSASSRHFHILRIPDI